MTKVTGLQEKKIGKRMHDLEWRMPAATTKVHKLDYKGNLDWLWRCSENDSRKASVM